MKIIALINSFCAGDIIFDQIVPDTQKIHQNKSKIWHKCTKFFLQSNLLKSIHDKLNPQKIYFYLFNSATRFRLSLKSINWKAQRGKAVEYDVRSATYTTNRLLVTLPTGYIQITSGSHFIRDSEMMFLFDLHYSLGTNLTFHRIYFPVRLPVCHRHHLYVTKYKRISDSKYMTIIKYFVDIFQPSVTIQDIIK